MSGARNITVTGWVDGSPIAELTVWPIGENKERNPELEGRLCVAIYSGAANLHLRPTADEARRIIAALEWALQAEEVAA